MSGTHREGRNTVPERAAATDLRVYDAHAAKARKLFEAEYSHIPEERRPRWESVSLERRAPWLNKAARQITADNRRAADQLSE